MERQAAYKLAKHYAELNIPTFPINDAKEPALPSPGFKLATTNLDVLLQMFKDAPKDCGVGALPGPAGYIVLDVDDKDGHTGTVEWNEWQDLYGAVRTATVVTPSGGYHYWFKKPADKLNVDIANNSPFKHEDKCDIDIRSDGGYVGAAGTTFAFGSYTWLIPLEEAIEIPTVLYEQLEEANVVVRGSVTEEDIDDCGREMYELLVSLGAWGPVLRVDTKGNKGIYLTRPGRSAQHESVSLGHINPDVAHFFTSSWKLPDGRVLDGKTFFVDELKAFIVEGETEKEFSELVMAPEAFRGSFGEAVNLFGHTEADPVAILMALLTGFGNIVGRNAYVENVWPLRQYPALFTLVVGASSRARKSAAWSMSRMVLKAVDEPWATDRMKGGFGSGQVIITTLEVVEPIITNNTNDPTQMTIKADPRLLIGENEFGNVLKTVNSENSVYSEVLRNGYDSEKLENRTKGKGHFVVPEGHYHLSLFANITGEELQSLMNKTELYNGFGNRFLYVWAKRSKVVAFSERQTNADELERIGSDLAVKVELAQNLGRVKFSHDATLLWKEKYEEQELDEPGGVLETVIARSGNHTQRLALIYALADGSSTIEVEHLEAALAVWDYCRATAAHVFKDRPKVERSESGKRSRLKVKIAEYLHQNGPTKKTVLRKGTTSHSNEGEFQATMDELLQDGTVQVASVKSSGAPSMMYSLVTEES